MRPGITIFGSSSLSPGSLGYAAAFGLGGLLAQAGYDVINGGYGGAMEATGRGAKAGGARVTGVTVSYYGHARDYVDVEETAQSFWDRTQRMLELGTGWIALPGSTGTLAEAACAWEAVNKGRVARRPLVFLGVFWRPLVEMMCPTPASAPWRGGAVKLAEAPADAVRFLDEFLGRAATA